MKRSPFPPRTTPLVSRTPLQSSPWPRPALSVVVPGGAPVVPLRKERGKNAATGARSRGRGESFPPAVAALIDARDPWCVLCGSPFNLHRHHRRIRGDGGDPRPHTHCTCNGVRVCARDHAWIHDTAEGRRLAEAEGLIIPRATTEPWAAGVLVHLEADTGGLLKFPSCDGRWLDGPLGGAA